MATVQALLLTLATLGQGNETVLLDFTASWCGPCQQVAPVVHQLAAAGYPIRQVDIDQNRALAQKYGVSSIPCFVMLVDGKEVARELGPISAARMQQMIAMGGDVNSRGNAIARGGNQQGGATFAAQSPDGQDPFSQARGHAMPRQATPPLGRMPAIPNQAGANPGSNFARPASLDQQLLAATVRIKVQDPDGHSYGTGTIIHQTQGKALILTCAHLFRDSKGHGTLKLDLFGQDNRHGVPAQLLDYDLERDVALMVMETTIPQQIAPVGLSSYVANVGQPIYSVGCSGGDDPTVWTGQVTSIDKYLGPPNIQASGQPKQGRSGGGLFDAEGRLIGVCNAADPADNEGLYAALGSIHAMLAKHDLAYVASADGLQPGNSAALAANAGPTANTSDAAIVTEPQATPSMSSEAPGNPFASNTNAAAFNFPGVTTGIARNREDTTETDFSDSTEIICLIRSKHNPMGEPKVVVISNASPEVLEWLAQQSTDINNEPQLTTQKVHKVQRPRLWEPVLRVRTQQMADPVPNQTNNVVPNRIAQPPGVSPAVRPGNNDVPWRPAHVVPNPARIR